MNKVNPQVNGVALALQIKLADTFGTAYLDRKTILQLAKELGYLETRRGRDGGTFATQAGMTFANLSGELIRPLSRAPRATACVVTATDVP